MLSRWCLIAGTALFLLFAPGTVRAGVDQWDFNGDLSASTGSGTLVTDATSPPASVTFTTALINGSVASVASFGRGSFFRMTHGFAPNGGGLYVNQYTLILDVMFPDRSPSGGWAVLWQTNTGNANDGDWFVNPADGVGIAGNYGGSVPAGTWRRLALVVDLAAGTFTSYVNGVQVQQNTAEDLDGRFSLDPEALIFADNDGDDSAGLVSSIQFRDEALSAAAIARFGGPTAAGISEAPACGQDYFAENFNAVASDADLDAIGWQRVDVANTEAATFTTSNPCGRRNPPTADGRASTGKFIISDSDCADPDTVGAGTGQSHDLITPSFSTVGGSSVWLHASCSAQLNNDGDTLFDVDASTDGGLTWTNAFRRASGSRTLAPAVSTANADGFFGRLSVDLSAIASDKADVRIRFRNFEDTDDWWIALDDIRVSCEGAPQPGNCTALAKQEFSAGLGAMKAVSLLGNVSPATWSTTDVKPLYTAGVVNGRGISRINQPGAATEFAVIETAAAATTYDEYLLTPVLNCVAFTDVILSYKSEMLLGDTTTYEVLLSLDGGLTPAATIFSYSQAGGTTNGLFRNDEESFYSETALSVPAAVGQPNVVIGFHFKGPKDGSTRRFWALDDIEVTGVANQCDPRDCGLRNFAVSYDPGTNQVTGTWSSLPGDTGFNVVEGARVVAAGLPAGATSFTDTAPPPGGTAVTYTLQTGDRECASTQIQTYACPSALSSRADQVAKTVKLTWTPGVNLDATGYSLTRNGVEIATPTVGASSYTDTPPLPTGEPGVFTYELTVAGSDADKCGALSARAIVTPGHVCFTDDFEDYANDVDFELGGWFRVDEVPNPLLHPGEDASWTVRNPGHRANPPTFDGRASTGRFAISDSDDAGGDNGAPGTGNSNDLWSPGFSTIGKSAVWLHMDTSAQLNDNGKVVFDVDVSLNGGASWTNVYRRVAPSRTEVAPLADTSNADGFFGRLDVDLSTLTANKPAVQFRLRSFEPSDDWWVAIDNVIVDDLPPLAGGSDELFAEDFAGGLGSMTAASLAVPPNSGNAIWSSSDPCTRYTGTVGGRNVNRLQPVFAIVASTCNAGVLLDEYLLTPALDCSLEKEVFLGWASELDIADTAVQEVLVSLDGGDSFEPEPIFSYNGGGLFDSGEEPFYARRVFSVPPAAGQSNVVFAFHYKGAGEDSWWAVDDVRVTGTSICKSPFSASIAGAASATVGDTVHLTSSTDATAPASYAWAITGGTGSIVGSSTADSVDVTSAAIGSLNVGLTVKDACGKSASAEHSIDFKAAGGLQKPNDENQDGKMDLSDAKSVLDFLFTGQNPSLACGNGEKTDPANIALLDANGDGKVDISDEVRLLHFLFVGDVAPPANCSTIACPCITIVGCAAGPGSCGP